MVYKDIEFDLAEFGRSLKFWRISNHMTQSELADRLFVTQQYVSLLERGVCLPDLTYFFNFLNVFDIDVYKFFFESISN